MPSSLRRRYGSVTEPWDGRLVISETSTPRTVAWPCWAFGWSVFALSAFLLGLAVSDGLAWWEGVERQILVGLFTFLGVLIRVRRPGNRISGFLMAIGVGIVVNGATASWLAEPPESSVSGLVATAVHNVGSISLIFVPLILTLFLFPEGRFTGRGQVVAAWIAITMAGCIALGAILAEEVGPVYVPVDHQWLIANPIGVIPLDVITIATVFGGFLVILGVWGVGSLVAKYRTSSEVVRAQLKWFLLSGLLLTLSLVAMIVVNPTGAVGAAVLTLALGSIPVTIAIAIVRHRLFEIDRIIARTVTYSIVVASLVLVLYAIVAGLAVLVPSRDSSLMVAASTLFIAALFNPLRKRVHQAVERRFNRSAFEGRLIAEGFASTLNEHRTVEDLANAFEDTVVRHLQPSLSGVWINEKGD